MSKSLAEQFVDLLNEHLTITETEGTEAEGLEYLCAEIKPAESLDSFVTQLFAFIDCLAPKGYHAVVGERTGFKLVPDGDSAPTETLESGVVVVPVPECRHPKATLSAVGLMLLQQARAQEAVMSYDAAAALRWAAKAIEAALSRLQQKEVKSSD